MDNLLRFLTRYEILFFALIGIVLLIYVRKVYLAWREWSITLFGLEKENSQRKINQGLSILIFSALVGVGLFIMTTFVAPRFPGLQQVATPTVDLSQAGTLPAETPTVQLTAQGLIPTLTAFMDKGCLPGQIEWTFPRDGGSITGKVELKGTVNITNLGFYKYEYAVIDRDVWTTIAAGNKPITDAPLGGAWETKNLTPGDYRLRLVVTNNQNEALPECTIKITIKASS
jgi:hypothetical protein